jgi:hypothetical protein
VLAAGPLARVAVGRLLGPLVAVAPPLRVQALAELTVASPARLARAAVPVQGLRVQQRSPAQGTRIPPGSQTHRLVRPLMPRARSSNAIVSDWASSVRHSARLASEQSFRAIGDRPLCAYTKPTHTR